MGQLDLITKTFYLLIVKIILRINVIRLLKNKGATYQANIQNIYGNKWSFIIRYINYTFLDRLFKDLIFTF